MLSTLHTRAVAPATLELLSELMLLPELGNFALAGGTALALYKGHRVSIDLDLFTPHAFDAVILEQQLHDALTPHRTLQRINTARNTLTLALDGIKSDMIRFDYPMLQPIQAVQNIRLNIFVAAT